MTASALPSGRTSARTRSMPAARAIASAVRRLSPVSMTTSSPSRWSSATASTEPGLERVGDGDDGRPAARRGRRRPASCRPRPARRRRPAATPTSIPAASRKPGATDQDRRPVDGRPDARHRRSPRRRSPRAGRGRASRSPRARWRRRADARSRARRPRRARGARSSAGAPAARTTSRDPRLALGERAGLVEHDRPDRAEPLERLGVAEQDAGLGALARADHDRGRRGEPERAGAGDDQDGDGVEQREVEGGRRADDEPDDERQRREPEHGRDEVAGDDVGQALDRRPRALGLGHEPDDPGEHGVRADPRRPEGQRPGRVERAADDQVARRAWRRAGSRR